VPPKKEISSDVSKFGANVRRERTARKLTQEKLAEMVDLNIRTVQKVEGGEINVLITTACRLQRALQCDWNKLMP